jgi:hypothetical protein
MWFRVYWGSFTTRVRYSELGRCTKEKRFVSLIIPWGNAGKLQLGAEVEPLTGEIGVYRLPDMLPNV